MPDLAHRHAESVGGFAYDGPRLMRYSQFAPRLYNLCKRLGFRPGRTLPSRAFCSDENQGYPIILLAKHFGTFPFNHGRVGGIVSLTRHAPHAEHGTDLVLVQASHVGYDPDTASFGRYRRLQTELASCTPTCGKIGGALDWYTAEYRFAGENVLLTRDGERLEVTIDNLLLNPDREEGVLLHLDRLIADAATGNPTPLQILSTAKRFAAAPRLHDCIDVTSLPDGLTQPIGTRLIPELFTFRHAVTEDADEEHHLEHNLRRYMTHIVTAPAPMLLAAQLNSQVEFDRTYRSILRADAYRGRRLLLVSGLHIDISPEPGQLFPLTKFVPWAAFLQQPDGSQQIFEQDELVSALCAEPFDNPDEIDLEEAIRLMSGAREVRIG